MAALPQYFARRTRFVAVPANRGLSAIVEPTVILRRRLRLWRSGMVWRCLTGTLYDLIVPSNDDNGAEARGTVRIGQDSIAILA